MESRSLNRVLAGGAVLAMLGGASVLYHKSGGIAPAHVVAMQQQKTIVEAANPPQAAPERKVVNVWLPKKQMSVIEGREGVQWTHAPKMPPMPNLDAPPRIVRISWNIIEAKNEIAPGKTYLNYWGFEGSVPGPIIRLVEGDVLRLELTNKGQMAHNIDSHSIIGTGGGGKAMNVMPGETAIIEARMTRPGLFMYHCAPAEYGGPDAIAQHMSNGMTGAIMVQPRDKSLPINQPVEREWYLSQNEWYAKAYDPKKPDELDFDPEAGLLRQPQYMVFNGKVGALTDERALQARVGDHARLFVIDSGPNLPSYFHVIGQIFDRAYREGDVVSVPSQGTQTTLIPPGGSAILEMSFPVPEVATIVSHDIFSLAQGGMAHIKVSGPENHEIYEEIKHGDQELRVGAQKMPPMRSRE